jgi:hypothetical protein
MSKRPPPSVLLTPTGRVFDRTESPGPSDVCRGRHGCPNPTAVVVTRTEWREPGDPYVMSLCAECAERLERSDEWSKNYFRKHPHKDGIAR